MPSTPQTLQSPLSHELTLDHGPSKFETANEEGGWRQLITTAVVSYGELLF